mmetsp:Transcript_39730/g.72727  ORF Transcript_39730/g.72727 Transcript_39730/m.72727 type:complete len:80 (-) Transcript_39730:15-254(-)
MRKNGQQQPSKRHLPIATAPMDASSTHFSPSTTAEGYYFLHPPLTRQRHCTLSIPSVAAPASDTSDIGQTSPATVIKYH